jgi:hypothetical protein
MAMRKLEKPEWRPFLDFVSKRLQAKVAEIEVASLDLGDQLQTEWLPLIGVTTIPSVEVALEGLDQMIHRPREIYLEDGGAALGSIEIVDADDTADY